MKKIVIISFMISFMIIFSNIKEVSAQEQRQMQQQHMQQQAQVNVSDSELGEFVEAFKQVQQIEQSAQQKMIEVVQESGLDVQKYNEIQRAQQIPDQEPEATSQEIQGFEKARQQVLLIQSQVQEEVKNEIEKTSISLERYEEIMAALRHDNALIKRFQDMLD